MNSRIKSSFLLAGILFLIIPLVEASVAYNYTYPKQFLLGLYAGSDDADQQQNSEALKITFLYGYKPTSWGTTLGYEEAYAANAVSAYSIEDGRITIPTTISEWKSFVESRMTLANFVTTFSHNLGEEAPEFFDKLYYDADNYVISRVHSNFTSSGNNNICYNANSAIRPDLHAWVKGIDYVWFYVYPFNFWISPTPTNYTTYQDSLQIKLVNIYNAESRAIQMYRKWGSPDLHFNSVFQAYQNPAYNPGGSNPNSEKSKTRKPTHEEILFQGWLAISRGAKGLAPFTYQNSVSGWVGLVDYYGVANDSNHTNYYGKDTTGDGVVDVVINVELPGNEYYNGDNLYLWVQDLFNQVRGVDSTLKTNKYGITNGLYDLDVEDFKSVHGGQSTAMGFVIRAMIIEPSDVSKAYYEIASFTSPKSDFFMLINRSFHLSRIKFTLQAVVPYPGEWYLEEVVSNHEYGPYDCKGTHQFTSDEIELLPGRAALFTLKYSEGDTNRVLTSSNKWATGYSNGRKVTILGKTSSGISAGVVYTDGSDVDYAHTTNSGTFWDVWNPWISPALNASIVAPKKEWPIVVYQTPYGKSSGMKYQLWDPTKGLQQSTNPLNLRDCPSGGTQPSIAIHFLDQTHYECHVAFYDKQSLDICHYVVSEDFFQTGKAQLYTLHLPRPGVDTANPAAPSIVCDNYGNCYVFLHYNGHLDVWDGKSNQAVELPFGQGVNPTACIEGPYLLLTWVTPNSPGSIKAVQALLPTASNKQLQWLASSTPEVVDCRTNMSQVQPMGANAALWNSNQNVYFSVRDDSVPDREPDPGSNIFSSDPWSNPDSFLAQNAYFPQSAIDLETYSYATAWTKGSSAPYTIETSIGDLSSLPGCIDNPWGTIHVTYPNGGQEYRQGDMFTVTWYSSLDWNNNTAWEIWLSPDGGSSYPADTGTYCYVDAPGFQHTPNTRLYSSTFKLSNGLQNSTRYRVKVKGYGGSSDASDRDFTIKNTQDFDVCKNNFFGIQPPGTKRLIYWEDNSCEGIMGVGLQYSLDNGNTWNNENAFLSGNTHPPDDSLLIDTIFRDTDTAYLYKYWGVIDWEVPNAPTSAAKIRLTAYDTLGDTASSVQDSSFVIPMPGGWAKNTWANEEIWGLNETGDKMELFYVGRNPSDTNKPIIYNTTSSDGYSLNTPDSFGIGIYPCHQRGLALWLSRTKDTIFSSYWDQAVPKWSPAGTVITGQPGADYTRHSPIGLDIDADTIHAVFERLVHRNVPLMDQLRLLHVRLNRNTGLPIGIDTITVGSMWMSGPEAEIAPSVQALSGKVVVAYQKNNGTCWFAQKPLTGAFTAQQIESGSFPVVAISEGNVVYSYLTPDGKSMIRLWRYVDDTTWNGRDTFSLEDSTTFMTAQEGILYGMQIKGDTISKTYLYDPLGKRFTLRATRDGSYLHSFIRKCDDDQWTECYTGNLDTFRFVKTETYDLNAFYPALYQEAKLKRSPYTSWRDTCIVYDSCVVDSGTDSLKYQFNRLSTSLSYNVMVELYFESDTTDTHRILAQLGTTVDTIEVPNNTFMWHYMEIPSNSSSFTLKLYRLDAGDFVSVSRLVVGKIDPSGVMLTGDKQALDPNKITFCLYQPFPNPFSDAATIRFALPYATNVSLKVYDVSGRLVNELVQGKVGPGIHTIRWEGKDNLNRKCASGVYFVRFVAQDYVAAKKMVMIK